MTASVSVLGIFAMDLIFRTNRLPVTGETVVGNSFATGPGGKGSNQAVAARRSGAEVVLISKLGGDDLAIRGEGFMREKGFHQSTC
jgi:ribokinase